MKEGGIRDGAGIGAWRHANGSAVGENAAFVQGFFQFRKIFQIIKGSLAAGAGTNAVCQLKAMAPGTASAVENVDFGSPV